MGNKLIDYVIASCSATPVLQPHKIKYGLIYHWYVDGGFNDNLMIDQALKDGYEDKTIELSIPSINSYIEKIIIM